MTDADVGELWARLYPHGQMTKPTGPMQPWHGLMVALIRKLVEQMRDKYLLELYQYTKIWTDHEIRVAEGVVLRQLGIDPATFEEKEEVKP